MNVPGEVIFSSLKSSSATVPATILIYKVSHKRRPIAKICKVDISTILPSISLLRKSGIFFDFEKRASFMGNPVSHKDRTSPSLTFLTVTKLPLILSLPDNDYTSVYPRLQPSLEVVR